MMKSIEKDIITTLSSYEDYSFDNVKVSEPYLVDLPDVKNNIVVLVQEVINSPDYRTNDGKEEYSDLYYQINIMARNQLDNQENVVTAREVVRTMAFEIVDVLYDEFLLERVGDFIVRPYSEDNQTVMELVFRVTGKIGLEHEYLYRR